METKSSDHVSSKNPLDTDSSTPALYSEKDRPRSNKRKMKMEKNYNRVLPRRKEDMEIAESIMVLLIIKRRYKKSEIRLVANRD